MSRHADRPIYLFLHHPPFKVGIGSLDDCMLLDPEPLGRLLLAHGNVRHIFYGHVHRPIFGSFGNEWRGLWGGMPPPVAKEEARRMLTQERSFFFFWYVKAWWP